MKTTIDNELDASFENSLLFYTILKMLIQCKISDKCLIALKNQVCSENLKNIVDSSKIKEFLLLSEDVVKKTVSKRSDYEVLVNTITDKNIQCWKEFCDLSVDLILIKDLILAESKAYINEQFINSNNEICDKLSLEFDLANLESPYGMRVTASLLTFLITDENRSEKFLLLKTNKTIEQIDSKVKNLKQKYHVTTSNIFSLIVGESINQSIKSDAGSSYETRFHETIIPYVDSVSGHSHDINNPSVEYDFTFNIGEVKVGASVKRTLRERYKQNFEEISTLTVDYMVLVTLGTDLNEEKLDNILIRDNIYIIVAKEIYESKDFLMRCNRVISSSNINAETFKKIFVKY